MSSPVVATLGKYQLVKKLATGGMAEVYLTKTIGPGGFEKTLVLKRVLPQLAADESFLQMFLSEAKLAAQLNHPNVVSIFDFGQEGDSWYLVMEFIDGPNLRALSKRAVELNLPIPFELAAKIVALACEGLAYAHELTDEAGAPLDLVHRDISPDNILLARNGAVKVVDFGIAKAANQSHTTKTGSIKGKFAYMPPEQLRGEPVDRRADVFALGIVLYELLTGSKPFATTTDALIMQSILFEPFTPVVEKRPDTPPALQAVLARALEKARDQRYPDCRALQADLEKFLAQQPNPAGQQQLSQLVARLANPDGGAMATPSRPSLPKLSPVEAAAPTQPMVPTPMPAPPPSVQPPPKSRTPIFAAVAGVAVLIAIGAFVFKGEPTPPAPVPAPVPAPAVEPERTPGVLRPLHPEVLQRPVPVETTPVPAPAEPAPRPKVVKPARVQFGQVDFRVRPFATVYVDGTLLGDTPFSKQKLSVGSHTVKLVNKELGKDKTLTLEVKPGDNTLKYNFESE